jgi:hypothetical protein
MKDAVETGSVEMCKIPEVGKTTPKKEKMFEEKERERERERGMRR